ncbi:MAG: hypothetical protein ACREBN_00595, partial [Burkholderiaceae bacterium]
MDRYPKPGLVAHDIPSRSRNAVFRFRLLIVLLISLALNAPVGLPSAQVQTQNLPTLGDVDS